MAQNRVYGLKRSVLNKVKIDKVNCVKDNKVMEQDELSNFIDGVINNNLEPKVNEVVVGVINIKIIDYLNSRNIFISQEPIKLTHKRIDHILRDNKNIEQKLTIKQLKNIKYYLKNSSVYFDEQKNNLIFTSLLPVNEVKNGRNIIKIPVNIYKNKNEIATASRISDDNIKNDKRYKKID